jgi:hypothetical protein
MTDNIPIPNPAKPEPKYRKKLNKEQVAVLQMLWRFRFASGNQTAKLQQKPGSKAVQKRLKILEDQNPSCEPASGCLPQLAGLNSRGDHAGDPAQGSRRRLDRTGPAGRPGGHQVADDHQHV